MYSTALEIYDEIIPQFIKLHGEKSVKVGNALYLKVKLSITDMKTIHLP